MKDKDIRKQIEDELNKYYASKVQEKESNVLKLGEYGLDWYKDQLIEARKTIQSAEERIQAKDSVIKLLQEQLKAKQESLERFILGEK
jgi:Tat protein secretion system quality control protein TatD with DNase activity